MMHDGAPTQDELFWTSEADAWFERNRAALAARDLADDPVLEALDAVGAQPASVLEIGASNGYRLHAVHERYGAACTAVEPSAAAIANGRQRYAPVRFERGVAHDVPIDGERFEVVILHFVLHWVDRRHLLASVAEADRLLADGGLLVLGDFCPGRPQRVRYHHRPDADAWTYKQDYDALVLATGWYERCHTRIYHHADPRKTGPVPDAHRARVSVLRKALTSAYPEQRLDA